MQTSRILPVVLLLITPLVVLGQESKHKLHDGVMSRARPELERLGFSLRGGEPRVWGDDRKSWQFYYKRAPVSEKEKGAGYYYVEATLPFWVPAGKSPDLRWAQEGTKTTKLVRFFTSVNVSLG